jgi:hypothetical protein
MRDRLNDFSDKLVGYESEIRSLSHLRDTLTSQLDDLKTRLSSQTTAFQLERSLKDCELSVHS